MASCKGKDNLLVVAIDFGTAYSGYAFQFKHDYSEKDPTKICAPQAWNGGKNQLMSHKTPTCLLLTPGKVIHSFGYEAETKYADLCMDRENDQWYFFRRFKMKLQDSEGLNRGSKLDDETGKSMDALDVFSLSIRALMNHLLDMLKRQGTGVKMEEIFWVLTVPAIWNDAAKQFMREAAKKAGICDDKLSIALEPEAASIFCQYLPVEKFCGDDCNVRFGSAPCGTSYMVLDLGGGTADITVHEKMEGGRLKEVFKASGGPWGGTAVDNAFWQLLISIVGGPVMNAFRRKETYDYMDMFKEFETVKRTISSTSTSKMTIKLPVSLNDLCVERIQQEFKDAVLDSMHKDEVTIVGDKIRFSPELIRRLFRKVTDNIVGKVHDILTTSVGQKISLILMVGGFSESTFVQDVVKDKVSSRNVHVLVPKEAGLSVLNGAVIYGRKPETMSERVLRYTYGTDITVKFIEGIHSDDKLTIIDDEVYCQDVFSEFIKAETSVQVGHTVTATYSTIRKRQQTVCIAVYATPLKFAPNYVDDPTCKFIGKLEVDIQEPTDAERSVAVFYSFGDTELNVLAMETENGEPCSASLKMIE